MVKGIKHTEIGEIPEDWEIVTFSEISDKNKKWSITGGPFGSNLKTSDYTDNGIQIIQLQNIGDGKFYNDYKIYTSLKKADELISCNIYPGEIILSKMGDPVARACFVPSGSDRYLMASDGIRLVVDEERFSKSFIIHYINSPFFRKRAFEVSTGSTRLRIGLPILKSLLVIEPSLNEQTAIAEALSNIEALINSLEKLIDKKRTIRVGSIQELLKPKKDWVEYNLGKDASLKARIGWQGLTKSEYKAIGDFYLVTGTDFLSGNIDWKNCVFVEENRYNQDKNIQLMINDVLVTKDGTIGKVALVRELKKPATLNSGVFVIRPVSNSFDPKFFFYILSSNIFKEFLDQLSAGSTINHLYQKDFVNFKFFAPREIKEQQRIAQILSDMGEEILALEFKLEKQKQLKEGMTQVLLTGKIRLI